MKRKHLLSLSLVCLVFTFISLYFAYHAFYEYDAIRNLEFINASDIANANFKLTATVILCVLFGLLAFGFFVCTITV